MPAKWTSRGANSPDSIRQMLGSFPNLSAVFLSHDHQETGVELSHGRHYFWDARFCGVVFPGRVSYKRYRMVELCDDGGAMTYQDNTSKGTVENRTTLVDAASAARRGRAVRVSQAVPVVAARLTATALEVNYTVAAASLVRLDLLDARGRTVTTLVSTVEQAGSPSVAWRWPDAARSPVAGACYFLRARCNGETVRITMLPDVL